MAVLIGNMMNLWIWEWRAFRGSIWAARNDQSKWIVKGTIPDFFPLSTLGTLESGPLGDVAPETCENFRCLCTGEKGHGVICWGSAIMVLGLEKRTGT